MTRSVEIPEAAREKAAAELYGAMGGSVSQWLDIHPKVQDHYRELADLMLSAALPYLAPAGDGGLREALEQALESPVELWHENSFRVRALPETVLRELLAAHPAAPAVPQPVDREALRDLLAWCRSEEEIRGLDDPYDWRSQGEASMLRVIGAKLQAVLAGEQEQVEK